MCDRYAIGNDSVDRVVAEAGTYAFDTSAMSCESALCINRTLIIEAEVPGAVVLNATGKWRGLQDTAWWKRNADWAEHYRRGHWNKHTGELHP